MVFVIVGEDYWRTGFRVTVRSAVGKRRACRIEYRRGRSSPSARGCCRWQTGDVWTLGATGAIVISDILRRNWRRRDEQAQTLTQKQWGRFRLFACAPVRLCNHGLGASVSFATQSRC
jgi:hypothetical protein